MRNTRVAVNSSRLGRVRRTAGSRFSSCTASFLTSRLSREQVLRVAAPILPTDRVPVLIVRRNTLTLDRIPQCYARALWAAEQRNVR